MCTVSWVYDETDGGYELLCNRDERHTRRSAALPSRSIQNGVRYLAPTDGDAGGTWISVNDHGVALSLLNGVRTERAARTATLTKSRGWIVRALAGQTSEVAAVRELRAMNLRAFPPFTLLVLTPRNGAVAKWDGAVLRVRRNPNRFMPLTSSSFDTQKVIKRRREEFRRMNLVQHKTGAHLLSRFHESHEAGPSAYSVCMHRPDARTVSFTRIKVSAATVSLVYSPGAPCLGMPARKTTLRRRA